MKFKQGDKVWVVPPGLKHFPYEGSVVGHVRAEGFYDHYWVSIPGSVNPARSNDIWVIAEQALVSRAEEEDSTPLNSLVPWGNCVWFPNSTKHR